MLTKVYLYKIVISFSPGFRWGMNVLPGSDITFEDVMTQTAITYPAVTRSTVTGVGLKDVLEDIADNRFNPDPYSQQGGDMVRSSGLKYSIDPLEKRGKRIQDIEVNGKAVDAKKSYTLASWASVSRDAKGKPAWEVLSDYLRNKKVIDIKETDTPIIKNVKNNKGISKG